MVIKHQEGYRNQHKYGRSQGVIEVVVQPVDYGHSGPRQGEEQHQSLDHAIHPRPPACRVPRPPRPRPHPRGRWAPVAPVISPMVSGSSATPGGPSPLPRQ